MSHKIVSSLLSLSFCLVKLYASPFLPDLESLTLDQKIGQIFITAAYSDPLFAASEGQGPDFEEKIKTLISEHFIGGVILKGYWQYGSEITKIQEYQSISDIPLFISQDLESGLHMRIPTALRFPKNMTLGAVQDLSLIEAMGREVGRQMRCIGVNYNFAPDVDINNNPANPVIHQRSFGDNPAEVAKRGVAMMRGLQSAGVLACAKHFPGHGDTATDSHVDLPLISFASERLHAIELYPFKEMIGAGVMSIMTAHLSVPALDPLEGRPASLSKAIVTGILQNEMGYQGLKVTDDLLMDGVRKSYDPGEACLEAFLAGNDLILTAVTPLEGIQRIKQAVLEGKISEEEITRRVAKILKAKEWLLRQDPVEGLPFTPEAFDLKRELYEEALTLVSDPWNIIPLNLKDKSLAVVQVGEATPSPFSQTIKEMTESPLFIYGNEDAEALQDYQTLVICLMGMTKFRQDNYGITEDALATIHELSKTHRIILVVFGSPYSLSLLGDTSAVILAYEDDPDAQVGAAKALFGKLPFKGKLPVQIK